MKNITRGIQPVVAQFEKVSFEQFKKDYFDVLKNNNNEINLDDQEFIEVVKELYDNIVLPKRINEDSPDYYFFFPFNTTMINGSEILSIPTGIKCNIARGWSMEIHSDNIHNDLVLNSRRGCLTVYGNYYNNNINEGHIWISVANPSTDKNTVCELANGQAYAAANFRPYGIIVDDEIAQIHVEESTADAAAPTEAPVETPEEEPAYHCTEGLMEE